jgi:hypothetical protein
MRADETTPQVSTDSLPRGLLDAPGDPDTIIDINGAAVLANAGARAAGLRVSDHPKPRGWTGWRPLEAAAAAASAFKTAQLGGIGKIEARHLGDTGGPRTWTATGTRSRKADSPFSHLLAVCRDASGSKRQIDALRRSVQDRAPPS